MPRDQDARSQRKTFDSAENSARKFAMAAFAAASAAELHELGAAVPTPLDAEMLRGPETGLVTVRGRIGGGGAPFNTGEATVTRATVRLASGQLGHAYALGRDKEKVRLAAILDAVWCDAKTRAAVEEKVVAPLRKRQAEADARQRAEAAATKVDFFTMVRGED